MGVAYGEFVPSNDFNSIKSKFEHGEKDIWRLQNLTLKTNQGKVIECNSGAAILAYESLENPILLEFSALGIDFDTYETLFPHHVINYENQFKS